MESNKICKHYVQGKCKKGTECDYIHIDNICRFHFFGTCSHGENCTRSHDYKLGGSGPGFVPKPKSNGNNQTNEANEANDEKKNHKTNKKHKLVKTNTESFEPFDATADMRIMCGNPTSPVYNWPYGAHDVILVNGLFDSPDFAQGNLYEKLLGEINGFGDKAKNKNQDIWKLWHGDTHYIADDHKNFKDKCPTFLMVVDKLREYFKCNVKATRFNWYSDDTQFKPLHFDAAAVDPAKAKTQNITIGVSFGGTRDVLFANAKTKTKVNIPLPNGSIYCFLRDTNIKWRHGIPCVNKIQNSKSGSDVQIEPGPGRVSIILWGWVDITE